MQSSSYEAVEQLIDDVGYEGFNASFARAHIDTDAVASYAEDTYEDDVRENSDAYFDDSERMLSDEQQEKIDILNARIEKTEGYIVRLKEQLDGTDNDESIEEKIEEMEELTVEYSDEIEEIEGSPEGDFPDDLIDEKVQELVSDVRNDPESFMNDFGLDLEHYIDKDEFIQDVIDTDGYGHTINTYDGSADEIYVNDKLFYVMRID